MTDQTKALMDEISPLLARRKYAQLYAIVREYKPADIALIFDELSMEDVILLFRLLPKSLAAETFVEMDSDRQMLLITAFSDTELRAVLDELYVDDTVDIIEEMPANVVRRIIKYASPEMRKSINDILNYPSGSAGSIMTVEFVDLSRAMTVDEAFEHIRLTGYEKETIYTCYVIDRDRHLEGVVTVQDLLLSDRTRTVGDIMDENVISCQTEDDREEVVLTLNKYGFLALPVVDGENRLVGIVTVDDAMDVLTEEATEDMERMAAILPLDKTYLKTGVLETWKQRIPWLLLLMVCSTFTGMIISSAEEALTACVALTAFIPMLTGTGGNAGGQTSVTVVRGLSLGELTFSDGLRILWKEFRVSILCGLTLGAAGFLKLMLLDGATLTVAAVVSLTMVFSVVFAKAVGCILPLGAHRLGLDPAVVANPFISTVVDALTLLAYFAVAKLFLPI